MPWPSACRGQRTFFANIWEHPMAETEKYWDDLGIEWRAVAPDPIAVTPRLARSLRLQKAMLKIAFLGGAVASMLGLFLGLRAIFIGLYRWSLHSTNAWFFITQGTAALAVSVMIAIAVVS